MDTTLSFIILNSLRNSSEVVYIKLTELVLRIVPSTSLVCANRNFFIWMLPFSQNSCRKRKILQRASSLSF